MASLLSLSLGGCIAEDMTDCDSYMCLQLNYQGTTSLSKSGGTKAMTDEISHVEVFVYSDETGRLKEKVKLPSSSIDKDNYIRFEMPAGDYIAVVWGYYGENSYSISNCETTAESSYQEMRLAVKCGEDGSLENTPALFHGLANVTVKSGKKRNEKTVNMKQNTKKVTVIIESVAPGGESPTKADVPESNFSVNITGSNGVYSHDNSLASECSDLNIKYMPKDGTTAEGYHQSDFKVLKMVPSGSQKDNMTLKLYDDRFADPLLLKELSVTEAIMSTNPEINEGNIDMYDDFEIKFQMVYNNTWVIAGIYVNDKWYEIGNSGGI